MHLKYKKENKMAMFVKSRRRRLFSNSKNDKWLKFISACDDVRSAREYVRERRKKITVYRGVLDYDTERPNACFVEYGSVVFLGMPAAYDKFLSVCNDMGQMGLCKRCGDCSEKLDNIMYNWAVKKLEIEKSARRQYLREFLGLENQNYLFWIPEKIAQFRRYKWLKKYEEAKAEALYSCYDIGTTNGVVGKRNGRKWDNARRLLEKARADLLGRKIGNEK